MKSTMARRTYTSEEIEQIALIRDLLLSGEASQMREGAHMLRSETAGQVPCHPSALGRWEEGKRTPRPDVALRLAEIYGGFAELASRHSEAV